MLRRFHVGLILIAICVSTGLAAPPKTKQSSPLQLTLPPVCYAAVGVPMSVYFDNVVLTQRPEDLRFAVQCDIGQVEARRWTHTPTASDVGDHRFALTVTGQRGKPTERGQMLLRVVPADAGAGRTVRLLIGGDSRKAATMYPSAIAKLLSTPGNPQWKMFGSRPSPAAAGGVSHEGYGGWTWARFGSHFEPQPDPAKRKFSSPFVFAGEGKKPSLDLPRYFEQSLHGERPDFVTFLLGINDCFGAKPDDPAAIDAKIDAMFVQADVLLAAFRKAAPQAELGICLTTPPNSRESGFEANYQGRYHRWGWKGIQHRIVQRQLERFGGREKQKLFLVPTELNLDPVDGYPVDNGVHPNAVGYQQIGASIYAWLKSRL